MGASLVWFIVRTTRPHIAELGRLPGGAFRSLQRHTEARPIDGALIVRMDASFYFGNVSFLKDTLRRLEAGAETPVRVVVLDASAINNLDSSAETALHELLDHYTSRGIRLILARVKGPVMDVLRRSGYAAEVGEEGFAESVEEALADHRALEATGLEALRAMAAC